MNSKQDLGNKKPKFIFFLGCGWAATTPLFLTVRKLIDYGWCKELHYLYEANKDKVKERAISEAKRDRTKEKRLTQLDADISIENYVSSYKKFWEETGKPCADFSNSNQFLNDEVFDRVITELNKEFEVVFLMTARDPVRRLWSKSNFAFHYPPNKQWGKYVFENTDLMMLHSCMSERDYVSTVERAEKYGKCYVIITEHLWDDERSFLQKPELEKISEVFNISLEEIKLVPNLYFPERGNKPIKDSRLKDQWMSDTDLLTEMRYGVFKKILEPHYTRWYEKFGSMPFRWGQPARYEHNWKKPIPTWYDRKYLVEDSYMVGEDNLLYNK